MTLKRDPIKYIRDRAKSNYAKGTHCYICDSTEKLDYHHYYTLTPLFNAWLRTNKFVINSEEDVLKIRDTFIEENEEKVYRDAVTLCHAHHLRLHSIYGKDPALTTAEKQKSWVKLQREKHGLTNMDG
jgi:hypothetical protein